VTASPTFRARLLARITDALTVLVFGLALLAMFGRSGFFGSRIERWRTDRATVRATSAAAESINTYSTILGVRSTGETIVEVGDYECPFCRSNQSVVDSALANGMKIQFVHYPLKIHKYARGASLSVICAEPSGATERLHRNFMSASEWTSEPDWVSIASQEGVVDTTAFRLCIEADSTAARLEANVALVKQMQVTGTPTYIGSGGVVRGVATLEQLLGLVP
jgi:protein-disulfide isomerase